MESDYKDSRYYWNSVYNNIKDNEVKYDLWLDKFEQILSECKGTEVIDLGCGSGNNSLYLTERGFDVIACDYSTEALKIVNKNLPEVKTLNMDFTKKIPFKSNRIKLIVADLCLHYFSEKITKNIFDDIRQVMLKDGYLVFRVNSIKDVNYGAGTGKEVEKHFYNTEFGYKRFYDEDDIRYFCSDWNIEYLKEHIIDRYGMKKYTIEVVLKK